MSKDKTFKERPPRRKRGAPKGGTGISENDIVNGLIRHMGSRSRVAEELNVSPTSISHRIKKSEKLQDAIASVKDIFVDVAESVVYKRMVEYNDFKAARLVLERWGRDRGWGVEPQKVQMIEPEQSPTQQLDLSLKVREKLIEFILEPEKE